MTLAVFEVCGGNSKTWVTAIIFFSLSYLIVWILSAVLTVSFVFALSHFLSFEQFVLPKSRAYCNTHFFVLILHKFCLLGKITKALHSTSAFVWTYFWTLRPVAEFWKNIRDKHSSSYGEKDLGAAVIKNRWFVGMGYKLVLVKLGDILETFYMVGFCGRKRNGRFRIKANCKPWSWPVKVIFSSYFSVFSVLLLLYSMLRFFMSFSWDGNGFIHIQLGGKWKIPLKFLVQWCFYGGFFCCIL